MVEFYVSKIQKGSVGFKMCFYRVVEFLPCNFPDSLFLFCLVFGNELLFVNEMLLVTKVAAPTAAAAGFHSSAATDLWTANLFN